MKRYSSYPKASCSYESQVTQYKTHVWKFRIILPAFLTKSCIKFSYWSFHRVFFFLSEEFFRVEFAADGHRYFFTVFVIDVVPILLFFVLFVKSLFFQKRETNLLYSLASSMSSSVLLTTITSFKSHFAVAFHRISVSLVLFPSGTIQGSSGSL